MNVGTKEQTMFTLDGLKLSYETLKHLQGVDNPVTRKAHRDLFLYQNAILNHLHSEGEFMCLTIQVSNIVGLFVLAVYIPDDIEDGDSEDTLAVVAVSADPYELYGIGKELDNLWLRAGSLHDLSVRALAYADYTRKVIFQNPVDDYYWQQVTRHVIAHRYNREK